jgi:thiamine-phosphate pyrophosphorylase
LVISDRYQAQRPLEELAAAVFAGGCCWFSLREKDLLPAERRALLGSLVTLGKRYEAMVCVHEDLDAAVVAGVGGVHLPSGSDLAAVRRQLPKTLLGASAHSAEQASALLRGGADYVTISPVFATASKPGYGPLVGLDGLARVVAQAPGPVIALGGVTAENAALCRAAGAHGVAVMGGVMRATNPRNVVETLLQVMSSS